MIAFVDKARSFSSTHSVEPMRPDSSAPQLQNLMVRLGRQPSKEEGMCLGDDAGCGDGGGDSGGDDGGGVGVGDGHDYGGCGYIWW